jgi:hypothetical protein
MGWGYATQPLSCLNPNNLELTVLQRGVEGDKCRGYRVSKTTKQPTNLFPGDLRGTEHQPKSSSIKQK